MKLFDELYENYFKDVYRFLYKLCGNNRDIAEELTQETFFHAYIGITKFRGECNIKTWLFGIAKNRYFLFLRKKKSNVISLDEVLSNTVDESIKNMENTVAEKQMITDALNIVFSFNEKMKSVFISRIYNEMSYAEIAENLGISVSSAKVMFYRAKINLRERLKEEYGYEI